MRRQKRPMNFNVQAVVKGALHRLNLDFGVDEFISEVKESIPSDWRKQTVSLTWQNDVAGAKLRSDRGKLKKVMRNLVQNAFKFTDRGSVCVRVSADDGWVNFQVSDTGIGIGDDAMPVMSIFTAFAFVVGSLLRIALKVAILSSLCIHINRKSDLPFGGCT